MVNETIILPSNKKFGYFFTLVFAILSVYFFYNESFALFYFFTSLIFIFLNITFFIPSYLSPLNVLWYKFGLLLGRIIRPVILGFLFFCLITPISVFLRIIGRDELKLKEKNQKSYWVSRKNQTFDPENFRDQF